MNPQKIIKGTGQLDYVKALQDYQILWSAVITYWIALIVGLIIAYITDKLIFNVFSVSVIGISALGTILALSELGNLEDKMEELKKKVNE